MTKKNGTKPEAPLLDLDALIEPVGRFRLNGKTYRYPHVDSFSLYQQKTDARDYQRALELSALPEISEEQSTEYEELVRSLIVRLSDMPESEAQAMSLSKLELAVTGFFIWRGRFAIESVAPAMARFEEIARRTLPTSSQDSPSAMEAAPSNG